MEFRDRVKEAMALAYNICKAEKSGGIEIPESDMKVLLKYESIGLVKLTIPRMKLQEKLYFPTIQAEEFKNLSFKLWVDIMLWSTKTFGIRCNCTINNAREYVNKPHAYGFIEPVIIRPDDLGNLAIQEEKDLFNELKEEFLV